MQTDRAAEAGTFVRGLRVSARVGVKPDELHRDQLLELDIQLIDDGAVLAADTGRLRDTRDYRDIASIVLQVVGRGHFRLVETLAVEICRTLLQRTRARAARVRLNKLDCIPNTSAAGVDVYLDQDAIQRDPKPITCKQVASPEAIAIVGGGVAGLSAALWCWRLGHPALLVDPAPQLGGQLNYVHFRMPDLPGLEPTSGHALARRFVRQFLLHRGRWLRAEVCAISADAAGIDLELRSEPNGSALSRIRARTSILATGLRRRRLDVPGEDRLQQRGILDTASSGARHLAGKRVLVVGGGDAACENALKLARAGAGVSLAYRRADLSSRQHFRRRVSAQPKITLLPNSEVVEFLGDEHLSGVRFGDGRLLGVDAALVRVGFVPNNAALRPEWLDERGFVRCDAALRVVGQTRLFVAGDLRDPTAPSVASSAGDGACAAKAATARIEEESEASS